MVLSLVCLFFCESCETILLNDTLSRLVSHYSCLRDLLRVEFVVEKTLRKGGRGPTVPTLKSVVYE